MDNRVAKLMQRQQVKALSTEWFTARKLQISASTASSLLIRDSVTCDKYISLYNLQDTFKKDNECCNPYSSKLQYFRNKVIGSKFTGSTATWHGQKYESVVADIYSVNNNTPILEFGYLKHPTISFLGCTPDGVTPGGIMIEIKAPWRRYIDGIPPLYYYIQCQIQMEVCDLDYCDFVEYSFVEFATQQEWLDNESLDDTIYNRGLFIQIEKLDTDGEPEDPGTNEYIYPPKEYIDNDEALLGFANHYITNFKKTDTARISVTYYKVVNTSVTRIERDKVWFSNILPVLEKEWKKILYYKKGNNHLKLVEDLSVKLDPISSPVKMDISDSPTYKTRYNNEKSEVKCILSDTEDEDE